MTSLASLHAITHHLTTTPTQELPWVAGYLALSLGDCVDIISSPQSNKSPTEARDPALLVHKLKTRITSLLQDKSAEGRWTAVILVKATVEAGQWEILRSSEPWVRALLAILGKPDPLSTRKLCVITLTRLFHLTHQYQTLVREITTPCLPTFITACLNLISFKQTTDQTRILKQKFPLLETVLQAFLELLPHHPTVFRPFSSQIHDLVLSLIGSPALGCSSNSAIYLAQQLLITLHYCAPRNASGEEWARACRSTISSIHRTGDHVFRAVLEQWESVDPAQRQVSKPKDHSRPVGDEGPDPLGLSGWQGINAGIERLKCLLTLLSEFILTQTSSTVSIPVGSILDLSSRLTGLTALSRCSASSPVRQVHFSAEIAQEEQEILCNALPGVHIATLELLYSIIEKFGVGSISIAQTSLDDAIWIFEAEKFNKGIRTATYRVVNAVLPIIGPSMTKSGVASLATIIRFACGELLSSATSSNPNVHQNPGARGRGRTSHTNSNADTFLDPRLSESPKALTGSVVPGLKAAAFGLLPNILNYLPTEYLSVALRAEIDRTAVLTRHERAMMASVLNPARGRNEKRATPSIMPFLARSHSGELGVEGFLRPRMPVLMGAAPSNRLELGGEEEDRQEPDTGEDEPIDFSIPYQKLVPPTLSSGPELGSEIEHSKGTQIKRSYQGDAEKSEQFPHTQIDNAVGSQVKRIRTAAEHSSLSLLSPGTDLAQAPSAPTAAAQSADQVLAGPAKFPNPGESVPSISVSATASSRVVTGDRYKMEEAGSDSGVIQTEAKSSKVEAPTSWEEIEESGDDIPMLNIESDTDENSDGDDVALDG